ncbi:hypothetical protein [Breznakiella homolactica]|uniref:Uncharacterized protein n=1 Tax=Breznakiella homolactica TaxID=2798577 RepID=A0A7T8B9R9_9SPIR|nr:hypothetical protein [Breznakiella homolactica]QQO08240.1 hypothetical protein JFL75_15050 [Breznakiella homolactica]
MFNLKISAVAAGAAFILSLLVGFFSGSSFGFIVLRAFIFAALFFILAAAAYWAVNQFIPELLETKAPDEPDLEDSDGLPSPGSRIDISVDSGDDTPAGETISGGDSPPARAEKPGDAGGFGMETGDEEENYLNSGEENGKNDDKTLEFTPGLDQTTEAGYNNIEGKTEQRAASVPQDAPAAVPGPGTADSVDTLPDLELMSDAFAPEGDGDEGSDDAGTFLPDDGFPPVSGSSSGKASSSGDFNVKEMASAIQTILRRDQKG